MKIEKVIAHPKSTINPENSDTYSWHLDQCQEVLGIIPMGNYYMGGMGMQEARDVAAAKTQRFWVVVSSNGFEEGIVVTDEPITEVFKTWQVAFEVLP